MHRVSRWCPCAAVLICVLGAALTAARDAVVVVAVRITDVRIPRDIVDESLREAARLYRRGQVSIAWAAAHHHAANTLCLIVKGRDDFRGADEPIRLGIAPSGPAGRIAYVFFEPVEALAVRSGADPARVLGAAIAHELGHLLLPTGLHSPTGLMQVRWGASEASAAGRGELRFAARELADIRARLIVPPPEQAASRNLRPSR